MTRAAGTGLVRELPKLPPALFGDRGPIMDPETEFRSVIRDTISIVNQMVGKKVGKERKKIALSHPVLFTAVYFPEWLTYKTPDFHWEMADNFMTLARYAVAAPTGSAKTTVITKGGNVWSMFAEGEGNNLIISSSSDLAQEWLDDIRVRVENSEEIREDFGDVRGLHWGGQDLEFVFHENGQFTHRAVLKSRGKGCALRGRRPKRVVVDDPEDEESVRSEKQRMDFDDWFRGALLTRLDTADKKLTFIGTAFYPEAYICKILNGTWIGWTKKAYSALDPEGKTIWPSKWSPEFLETKKAEMGAAKFAADFMNAPLRTERGRAFNPGMFRTDTHAINPRSALTLAVDPSFTPGGDDWSLTLVEQTPDGHWYLEEEVANNDGLNGVLEALFSSAAAYKSIKAIGIEAGSGAQSTMEFHIKRMEIEKGIRILHKIVWLNHTSRKSKAERILQLLPMFEAGRIHFKPEHREIRQEFLNWRVEDPNPRDNRMDSLSMHLELQLPARKIVTKPETEEQRIHQRFMGFKKVWDSNKRLRQATPIWGAYNL